MIRSAWIARRVRRGTVLRARVVGGRMVAEEGVVEAEEAGGVEGVEGEGVGEVVVEEEDAEAEAEAAEAAEEAAEEGVVELDYH